MNGSLKQYDQAIKRRRLQEKMQKVTEYNLLRSGFKTYFNKETR
jgi:hypothetical protein